MAISSFWCSPLTSKYLLRFGVLGRFWGSKHRTSGGGAGCLGSCFPRIFFLGLIIPPLPQNIPSKFTSLKKWLGGWEMIPSLLTNEPYTPSLKLTARPRKNQWLEDDDFFFRGQKSLFSGGFCCYTPGSTNIAGWKNEPGLKMYGPYLNMGIFQPAM